MTLSTLHFCDVLFHLVDIVQESFIDVHVPTCMGIVEIYYDLYVEGLNKKDRIFSHTKRAQATGPLPRGEPNKLTGYACNTMD